MIYNPTGKPLSSDAVANLLPGVNGYIAGLDVIDRSALARADDLKVISRYGVGVDNVDLEAARERGIVVTNTPGANSVSVAELAMGLILALARQIPEADQAVRQGTWPRLDGISLEGKSIGILGLGTIGKELARRLAGFDCHILAYDPDPDKAFAAAHDIALEIARCRDRKLGCRQPASAAPPGARGLVNREFLAKMKRGAILVNTSGVKLCDEASLQQALESGHLAGVGLDAFAVEPPDASNPLLQLPHVLATPHLAPDRRRHEQHGLVCDARLPGRVTGRQTRNTGSRDPETGGS